MPKPKVLITDNIHPQAADILKDACDVTFEKKTSPEDLLKKIGEFNALMIRSATTVTPNVLQQAKRLQIIGRAGVGTDNIDLPTATQRGVIVVNSPEGNTIAASEHTIGMLFALARHIPEGDVTLKNNEWARSKLLGVELFGKTLGVIGLGKIGSRVAKACLAIGMKVLVADPFLSKSYADEIGVTLAKPDDIWAQADFISIHAPKTKETANLINKETLGKCKKGVRIINCARGGIVDESALADAVSSGHVAGIAFDVFGKEPPEADNPLLKLGTKAVLTPHLGASTEEAQVNVAFDVAEQIRDFFLHGYAKNAVNIPLLRKEILDPVKDFMPMAETLAKLVRQLSKGPAIGVEILAQGTLSQHRVEPLTLAVLKGILGESQEGVNYVNALSIAEERGIEVKEISQKQSESYLNRLQITLKTDDGEHRVSGALLAEGNDRIVGIDDYEITIAPTQYLLLTPHHDRPGMIAKVAATLGDNGVNISALEVGRRKGAAVGGESLMVFNLDSALDDGVLDLIKKQDGIYDALYVRL